ncbi:hypothetical protein [Bartonella ancashensis]|uniref:Uncharacterized protein n=1 Tax=Bartonella ancashensis TaxID=1318743 RepID=A0A0M3T2Y6_9HYPH|nr:hypothetical protein PU02_0741 [Bartonella ancashensis]
MHEKIAHYQQRLQEIQTNIDTTSNNQLYNELREETKDLAATLAAQIILQKDCNSPLHLLIQSSKSKDDLASHIRKKWLLHKKDFE